MSNLSKGKKTAKSLLVAARDLFVLNGYAAVSMREIALKLGINAGAIYNHFPSKQEILFRLLEDHMLDLLEQWDILEVERSKLSDLLILRMFVNFHINFHIDKSKEVFLSYMELRSLDRRNFSKISKLRDEYESILQNILVLGKNNKNLDFDDSQITTKAILGTLSSLSHWYHQKGRLGAEDIRKIYWHLIFNSVRTDRKRNV
ncbi:TetR/AcrR family transcriptional regulator [Rhodobacteraceae bacterium]|nr:TetR/AcrR family transcriptional regulator [Paracoccaceae bacterium]MDC1254884.1 TetR/AcrR family transcriptional regulator [Paracoccaceae bacterium]